MKDLSILREKRKLASRAKAASANPLSLAEQQRDAALEENNRLKLENASLMARVVTLQAELRAKSGTQTQSPSILQPDPSHDSNDWSPVFCKMFYQP